MVCLGNICRSPMAEGVLRHKIALSGKDAIIDSAGTSNYHIGQSPDHRAVLNMKKNGINISNLKARQLKKSDLDHFDMIYVMDRMNLKNTLALADTAIQMNKVKLILDELGAGIEREVPDPYFGGDEGFQQVFEMLDQACDKIIARIDG